MTDNKHTQQDEIIAAAEAEAEAIRANARKGAEEAMKRVLKETGTWIEQSHHNVNPLVARVQATLCVQGTHGRKALDFLLGAAKECYCCAAIRGFVYGVVLTAVAASIIAFLL